MRGDGVSVKNFKYLVIFWLLFPVLLSSCRKTGSIVYKGGLTVSHFGGDVSGEGVLLFSKLAKDVFATIIVKAGDGEKKIYVRGHYKGNPEKDGEVVLKFSEGSEDSNSWYSLGYEMELPVKIENESIKINLTQISRFSSILSPFKGSTVVLAVDSHF